MILFKTLAFVTSVHGAVTILGPYLVLTLGPSWLFYNIGSTRFLGIAPIVLGAAGLLWCAWDFSINGRGTPSPLDPPKELVASRLYRFSRNPMYVSIHAILIGEAWLFQSVLLWAYVAGNFLCYHLLIVCYEEPILRKRFGAPYEQYCRTVRRWIPG